MHRRKSSCLKVQKLDGNWTQSLFDLNHECSDHFQNSPAPNQSVIDARQALLSHVQPIMPPDEALSLEHPFKEEEIHNALLHLGKGKSLGWDGLTVKFYLAFWDGLKYVMLQMINTTWTITGCLIHGTWDS